MNFLKRLFCKHEYKSYGECKIEYGMGKLIFYKCLKCGKTKCKTV